MFQRLDDPKEIVGMIFLDIVYEIEPDMKKAFSIKQVPKAGMLRMPKFGGHISRFTELLDKTTNMLGFTENLAGALQLVRKSGRAHTSQGYLEANQHNFERNYFEIVMNVFNERFIPFLTGQEEKQIENTGSFYEPKEQEQMLEDPF
ncbi:unnamed protein product [Angiostrongylus costaricensis]|uniref:GLOBIN domain-containing protein n=1 Tax=Angiostrongylus costaricensis TaxID=334426 RepID=A0A0R3PI38_ANGCS|nr:unnamed protein product [Angiostrongylus costaricensis]